MTRSKPGAKNIIHFSRMGCKDPSTGAMICCLPRYTFMRRWVGRSEELNQGPLIWNASISSCGLTCCLFCFNTEHGLLQGEICLTKIFKMTSQIYQQRKEPPRKLKLLEGDPVMPVMILPVVTCHLHISYCQKRKKKCQESNNHIRNFTN